MVSEPKTDPIQITPLNRVPQALGLSSQEEIVMQVQGLGKCYKIYQRPRDRIKQALWGERRRFHQPFWALRGIAFDLRRGEALGVIGRNGAGKSTLLKLLAGTLSPTQGVTRTQGRVAPLLELGTGFNPAFSGRENVFINGAFLGIGPAAMEDRFDDIAAFADIGDFLDQPVKTYSSGMAMRLAFAVAIHVEAEILLVDEVLSVGDIFFQSKCLAAIGRLMDGGTSILLATHAPGLVKSLCPRALLLDQGRQIALGPCEEVMDRAMSLNLSGNGDDPRRTEDGRDSDHHQEISWRDDEYISIGQPPFESRVTERFGSGEGHFVECAIFQDGIETHRLANLRPCTVMAWIDFPKAIPEEGEVGIVVRTVEGIELFAINSFFKGRRFGPHQAGRRLRLEFQFELPLGSGRYSVALGYRSPPQGDYVDKVFNAALFEVHDGGGRPVPALFDVPGTITIHELNGGSP